MGELLADGILAEEPVSSDELGHCLQESLHWHDERLVVNRSSL